MPAAQCARVHLVAAVDVATPVTTAIGHTRACAATASGCFTDEVFPADRRAKRASPIQIIRHHRADHAVAARQVVAWVQPCGESQR